MSENIEKKMRIVIERHPNVDVTTYHLDRQLTESRRSLSFELDAGTVKMGRLFASLSGEEQNVEPFALSIAEKIYAIPGIANGLLGSGVSIDQYKVQVTKGRAFSDDEIEQQVLSVFVNMFGLTDLNEVDVTVDSYQRTRTYRREQAAMEREMREFGFDDDFSYED